MNRKILKDNISSSWDKEKCISKTTNLNAGEQDSKIGIRICQETPKCSSALFNELILDCIFGYLNIENIKECRLVCHRWNIVADPLLRKKSKVTISTTINKIQSFNSAFQYSETKMPFGSIIFRSDNHSQPTDPCDMLMLESFFTDWQDQIKALELDNVHVYKITTNPYKDTQVTSLCRKYFLNLDLLCNLASLTVDCFYSTKKTKITFHVDNLKSLKVLKLSNSVILHMSKSGLKITATEVELHDINFLRSEKILKTVLVNDFIDFNQTKKISLSQQNSTTKLFLDMRENITVDRLNLDKIEILGGKDAKWNITQLLSLSRVPWTTRNQVKFFNLNFDTKDATSILDIATLPSTIECLKVGVLPGKFAQLISSSSYPVNLNNLQYVTLNTGMKTENVLPLFKHCPKLTDVAYEYEDGVVFDFWHVDVLNVEWLPHSIRRLEIKDHTKVKGFVDETTLELETLVLNLDSSYKIRYWEKKLAYFNCQNLVICPSKHYTFKLKDISSEWYYNKLTSMITKFRDGNDRTVVYVGPVGLFRNCHFLKCVDISTINFEEATEDKPLVAWFRFTSEFGHAIEKSEFNNVRNLVNSDRFSFSPCPAKRPVRKLRIALYCN